MWAASAGVLASAMARSKASRASAARPSCSRSAPLQAEEVEVAGQRLAERLDHRQRRLGPAHLGHRHRAVQRHDRRGLPAAPAPRRAGRSPPSRCPPGARRGRAARRSPPAPGRGPRRRWRIALSISARPSPIMSPVPEARGPGRPAGRSRRRRRSARRRARAAAASAPAAP